MNKLALKAAIRRMKRNHVRTKSFQEYEKIERVVLFFNVENLEAVVPVVQALESDGKVVQAYCVDDSSTKRDVGTISPNIHVWNRTHLGLFSIPKKEYLDSFAAFHADTLLDLTLRVSLQLDLLYYHTQASYRVGLGRQDPGRFDLLLAIDDQHDAPFFFAQLLFYLKSLHTSK